MSVLQVFLKYVLQKISWCLVPEAIVVVVAVGVVDVEEILILRKREKQQLERIEKTPLEIKGNW